MRFSVREGSVSDFEVGGLIVFASQDGPQSDNPQLKKGLAAALESGEFGTRFGNSHYCSSPEAMAASRVLYFNIGEKTTTDSYRKAAATAFKALQQKGIVDVGLILEGLEDPGQQRAIVEGVLLGDYRFDDLRSERDDLPKRLESLTVLRSDGCAPRDEILRWHAIAGGTMRARDLCQSPANIMDPTAMARQAQDWGQEFGYATKVLDRPQLEELKMGSMLSVTDGSARPPKFITMEYQPTDPSGKTIALVGKAVTFDSGGLSLKPATMMAEMKGDMGGGAAVIGLMSVLRDAGCRHRVVGLVPAVENMPSGTATRPSDVVTSMSGLTIEVNNTDAEGRLIMADASTYAKRYDPDHVIDFATLTGACLVALGPRVFGVMGNDQHLVDHILAAGGDVDETFWQLPLVDEYNELLKSNVADVSNVGNTRWGGAITAGLFLQKFASETSWAHCDIAATIFEKSDAYRPAGGTGAGVRMGMALMDRLSS